MIFPRCRCRRLLYYGIIYSVACFIILYILDIKLDQNGNIPESEQLQDAPLRGLTTLRHRKEQFKTHSPHLTTSQVQLPVTRRLRLPRQQQRQQQRQRQQQQQTQQRKTKSTSQASPICKPKKEFVYIKTHKTASSTTCNIFYRFALKYDIPMLLFTIFPYPLFNLSLYLLQNEPLAGVQNASQKRFMIAADHMRYEREVTSIVELDKVMTGNPAYITTLRYPPDHLRSLFHYFHMDQFFGFSPEELKPVQYYIQYKDKYLPPDPNGAYRLENRNVNMFGIPEEDMSNETAIRQFIRKMDKEFNLVMITEHFMESLVLLRRTMCWGIGDILFASINKRLYLQKGEPFHPELIKMHRKWNLADYIMYEHFNKTLWRKIAGEGDDFWDEMDTLRDYQQSVDTYCDSVHRILKFNPDLIFDMYNFTPPLILPKSKWGPAVTIDFVTCALMRVDIMPFANLMRVKQYPDLCKHLSSDQLGVTYLTFKVDRFGNKVRMMPQYCSRNPHKTVVPLASLTIRDMYMWE